MLTKKHRRLTAGAIAVGVTVAMAASPAVADPLSEESVVADVTAGLEEAIASLPATGGFTRATASVNRGSEFDLDAALACVPVDDLFYCPLDAWYDEPRQRVLAEPDGEDVVSSGDVTWDEYIAQVRALPVAEQVDLVRQDLEGAISATGKVLADDAVLQGESLDPELVAGLPGVAAYLDDFPDDLEFTPLASPNFSHRLMTTTSAKKQERSYWCGPASLAFMSYHDPVVKNTISHTQSQWASWIGTTTAGSNINTMKNQINARLTGYSKNVGGYSVFSISSWTVGTWQSRFANTTYTKKAPILLHPKLTVGNSSYIPSAAWNTGGHFNVGVGYKTYSSGSEAWIFEPYAADGSIDKFVWEMMGNVRQQNLDNSSWRNIAY